MKKILLISTNALGDTYIACSAFKALKEFYKDVQIDMVSSESSRFFLKEIGFDNLFLIKRKSYFEVIKKLREVRKVNYDVVFNFFPGQVNSIFFSFSKSKDKAGFKNLKKVTDWHESDDTLILNSEPVKNKVWKHTDNFLERVRLPLSGFGILPQSILKPLFNFKENNSEFFDIVIHPFSSDARKSLLNELVIQTIKVMQTKFNQKVCIIGSSSEIEGIKKVTKDTSGLDFKIDPDIQTLVGLLKNCKLFIGVDSFPIHIADAHNIKTLGIFSITNENSVFQSMNNKYILRTDEMSKLKYEDITNFIKTNGLI